MENLTEVLTEKSQEAFRHEGYMYTFGRNSADEPQNFGAVNSKILKNKDLKCHVRITNTHHRRNYNKAIA